MARSTTLSAGFRRLGVSRGDLVQLRSQCPETGCRLSRQRYQIRHLPSDVQRGRRQHNSLDGSHPALSPLRLSRSNARWRGRRLAAQLFRPREVLRPERQWMGCSGSRATLPIRPVLPGPCHPCRSVRTGSAWRGPSTSSAGTGGRRTPTSIPSPTRVAALATIAGPTALAARSRPRAPRTSPIGRPRSRTASSSAPARASTRSSRALMDGPPERDISIRPGPVISSRRVA